MVYEYTKPRAPIAAMYSSPGPCYGLPALTGDKTHDPRSSHYKQPAYSFGVRHGKFKDDCSPGPCYYPNTKVSQLTTNDSGCFKALMLRSGQSSLKAQDDVVVTIPFTPRSAY